ncbi:MAG: hypothetical protein AAGA12_12890 [Pseudomonadota bacterium]
MRITQTQRVGAKFRAKPFVRGMPAQIDELRHQQAEEIIPRSQHVLGPTDGVAWGPGHLDELPLTGLKRYILDADTTVFSNGGDATVSRTGQRRFVTLEHLTMRILRARNVLHHSIAKKPTFSPEEGKIDHLAAHSPKC